MSKQSGKTKIDFYTIASGYYLTENLPDGWAESMSQDRFDAYLEDHAANGFEYTDPKDLAELIDMLAWDFLSVYEVGQKDAAMGDLT